MTEWRLPLEELSPIRHGRKAREDLREMDKRIATKTGPGTLATRIEQLEGGLTTTQRVVVRIGASAGSAIEVFYVDKTYTMGILTTVSAEDSYTISTV